MRLSRGTFEVSDDLDIGVGISFDELVGEDVFGEEAEAMFRAFTAL